ncbi:pyruvate dehydrogenase E1 component subunit alpha [Clostridia bacterium]|nr:pyruvate dehydrogenase E1 component subunit alpha [Clostridia bacterium]
MELVVYREKPNPEKYSKEFLVSLLSTMKAERIFDVSVIRMISAGKIAGFYHAGSGQEAIAAGSIKEVLRKDDYLFYMHRGCNEMIAKGVPIDRLYADFFGNIYGTNRGLGAGIIHGADPTLGVLGQPGTIGSNMPLACGVGMAINQRKSKQVVYATFGDGTANRELLHGAFNYAGIWKLPVIFMCQNNEYALASKYTDEHALADGYIASRGLSYGIPSYVVDGNDVLAVYEVSKLAVERARNGEGATFIEAKTLRQNGHFVGDPRVYMDKERLEWFITHNDPISNFEKLLLDYNIVTQEELDELDHEITGQNDAAIEKADSYPLPGEERLYEGLYSTSAVPQEVK